MQQQSVEINSVKWVLKELQPMLKDVQRALETCAEQSDGFAALQDSVHVLKQARGTLQMVELYGAAQLADEMQHAAQALIDGSVDNAERALETLLRTALQLPDYLERLQAGSRDVPLVLLPLLNDLRAARGAELLTDRELFFPDLSVPPRVEVKPIGSLKVIARAQRRRFQRYLLAWLKGHNAANLQGIDKVLAVLEQASVEIPSRRVWYIARSLVESCLEGGLAIGVLQPVMAQIDRLVRTLVNAGERRFQAEISLDFLKSMLYQVARSSSAGQRVTEVRATYQLAKLLPSQEQIALAKQTLAGPNLELLAVVNSSIKEDISQIKDAIEIYVHSEDKNREQLRPLQELFGRVSDTVHMLGIDRAQQLLKDHAAEVASILESGSEVSGERLMALAGVLLSVEETLDEFVTQRADLMGNVQAAPRRDDTLAIAALPGPEFQALLSAVIREALGDLARAREGMLAFLSNPDRMDHLHAVPALLNEVKGAMFMLPLDKVVPLLAGLADYVRVAIIAARRYPSERDQNLLADVVAAIEYYLEAVEQGRGDMTHILARGERALTVLRSPEGDGGGSQPQTHPAQLNVVRERPTAPPRTVAAPVALSGEVPVDNRQAAPPAPAAPSPPPPAPAAAVPIATARQDSPAPSLAIIGEDVDEEILEVFLEEALGELQEISKHLPQWQADTGNETSLVRIRRAFHTLKGSGRVIGAELIGEFAWSMEKLLNQVIAGRVVTLEPVFGLLDEAVGVLPQLIEQLRGNPEPVKNVMDLVARGHALADPPSEAQAEKRPQDGAAALPADSTTTTQAAPEELPQTRNQTDSSFEVEDLDDAEGNETVTLESTDGQKEVLDNFEVEDVGESSEAEDVTMESVDETQKEVLDNFEVEEVGDADDAEAVTMESAEDDQKEVLDNFEVEEVGDADDAEAVTMESAEDDQKEVLDNFEVEEAEDSETESVVLETTRPGVPGNGAVEAAAASAQLQVEAETAPVEHPRGDRAAPAAGASEGNVPVAITATLEQPIIDPVLLDIFTREAEGHIEALHALVETALSRGGHLRPQDELIRGLHTLHGSAQTAEVEHIAVLSGTLERIAKAKQEVDQPFDKSETELFRDCLECLDQALKWFTQRGEKPRNLRELQAQLRVLEKKVEGAADTEEHDDELIGIFIEEGDELLENADRLLTQWRQRPRDQRLIADLQRQLHTLKGGARMANFTPIADLSHGLETLVVNVTEQGLEPEAATFELLHEAVDALTVMLEQARDGQPVSRVDWLLDELVGLSDSEARRRPPELPVSPAGGAEPASEEQQASMPAQEQVRVSANLLDNLVNYAGEVNIYQSRLGQQVTDYRFNLEELDQTVFRLRDQLRKMEMETEAQILHRHEQEGGQPADEEFDPLELDRYSQIQELSRALMESVADLESIKGILGDLTRDSESLLQQQTRLSSDLQDGLMRTRMIRFDRLSARLTRVVRQTSTTLGKKAELQIRGGETEIDRTVQERIVAPLEHMLRNAVSHGIESPAERRRLDKPAVGRILIDLQRDGSDVLITVEDDGGGINLQAVRAKAIARGLLTRDVKVSNEDLLQLVLETGMSTAQEVTQISGRGVGMDVVASEIKQLGGAVNIETNAGKGTRFIVRLPLTLAINQALLVDVAGDLYALPLAGIVGVSQVDGTELQRYYVDRSQKYHYAAQEYEIQHLGTMLDVGTPRLGEQNQVWPLIMLRSGEHRVAMHVEGLVGRREVVVKPVGPQISTVRGISGATILADGRVVLILDAASLLRALSTTQAAARHEPIATAEPQEARVTVMVVDDSITIRKVTQRMLERHEINVLTAKDGVDAVTMLGDQLPDLMLLDIEMPRMDGYEVAAYVRNNERLRDIPIIMITSRTGDKHRRRAKEIGVDEYLGKPYQENELLEHINRILAENTSPFH